MKIPLRAGRYFTERDATGAPGVLIIDELLAQRGAYYELYRYQAVIHEVEAIGRTEGHR